MCRTCDASTHTHAHSFQFFSRTAFVRSVNKPTLSPAPQNYGDSLDASWRGNRPISRFTNFTCTTKKRRRKSGSLFLMCFAFVCYIITPVPSPCTTSHVHMNHISFQDRTQQLLYLLFFFFFKCPSPITKDERKKEKKRCESNRI